MKKVLKINLMQVIIKLKEFIIYCRKVIQIKLSPNCIHVMLQLPLVSPNKSFNAFFEFSKSSKL